LARRELIGLGGAALAAPTAALAASAEPLAAPILLAANRLWVTATINGRGPYFFCVDTGTTVSFLRPEIAEKLALPAIGTRNVSGIGANRAFSGMVEAREVLVGERFRLPPTTFQVYDFSGQLPPQAAGLLAATIFTGRDCELDFEKAQWRLWPDGRRHFAGLERLPSRIIGSAPFQQPDRIELDARLDGKSYHLQVDTGSPPGLMLFGPAAKRSGLFDDSRPFAPQPTRGFGGNTARPSRVARAQSFEMGPLRIDRPLVSVMDPNQFSAFAGDGLIGLQFLQLLTLATDTRHYRLWASRNGKSVPADDYALSGLWLEPSAEGGARVTTVGKGSPAEAAGVRDGDSIVSPSNYAEAMQRTNGPAGQAISLGIRRGGATLAVRYVLAPWL